MKRKPIRSRRKDTSYPDHTGARSQRRRFLKLLGKGLLAMPLASLASSCGVGRDEFGTPGDQAPPDWQGVDSLSQPDYQLGGVAPMDLEGQPDLQSIDVGGVAPADIEEEFPPMLGDMPAPDVVSAPDNCTITKDVEEDFPALPGEAPYEPDVKTDAGGHADVKGEVDGGEEWPLDGDMEWPEE